MASTTVTYVAASDDLRKSVGIKGRNVYRNVSQFAALLSGATGAVAAVDAIATGVYADQKRMAEGTGVSETTIGRLVNAGRIIIDLDPESIGRESEILSAVNYVGVKAAQKAVETGGLAALIDAMGAEKARRADKQKASTEKGDTETETGDTEPETIDVSKSPINKILRSMESLCAGLAARAPKRIDAVGAAALVSMIDSLTAVAVGAGIDLDAVRAEIAA